MTRLLMPAIAFVALMACSRDAPPAPGSTTSATSPAPNANMASATTSLDTMDKRAPVPLLPMMANHQKQSMRDHLVAVQEIVSAMATEDFAGIERAAGRIGFSEQMGQMCTHMGAGAPGFTEQALAFHHTADEIATAAKKHDGKGVAKALHATLKTCTTCHAAWKQQIVDEATWQTLTSVAPAHPARAH